MERIFFALYILAASVTVYAAVELHRASCAVWVLSHSRWQSSLKYYCDRWHDEEECASLGDNPLDLRYCKAIMPKR
jgi:hypothetical protein